MKLAKNAGRARGSGLLYKDICWLLSLGRPGREVPGSEMCKEIETTRQLLKEHSTETLTASHSKHEAIKTRSRNLPSLYFTQQENLGCPGWQNNIRPPKSSQGLSHSAQACDSTGTQNIQHRPDWIFHCYCEVLAHKKKKKKSSIFLVWFGTCFLHTSDVFTYVTRWQIGVCLAWRWHACRQVCLHESLRDIVSALCVAGGDRELLQVAHALHCDSLGRRTVVPSCRCLPWHGSGTGPKSHNTAPRAFHLTEPDHWS